MNKVMQRTGAVALGVVATLAMLVGSASAQAPTADPQLTSAVSDATDVLRVNLLAVFAIVVGGAVVVLAALKGWGMVQRAFSQR